MQQIEHGVVAHVGRARSFRIVGARLFANGDGFPGFLATEIYSLIRSACIYVRRSGKITSTSNTNVGSLIICPIAMRNEDSLGDFDDVCWALTSSIIFSGL